MHKVWFDTPYKGALVDTCWFDDRLETWVSADGWIWPRWVKVIKIDSN